MFASVIESSRKITSKMDVMVDILLENGWAIDEAEVMVSWEFTPRDYGDDTPDFHRNPGTAAQVDNVQVRVLSVYVCGPDGREISGRGEDNWANLKLRAMAENHLRENWCENESTIEHLMEISR